jgi:hypothetical protein
MRGEEARDVLWRLGTYGATQDPQIARLGPVQANRGERRGKGRDVVRPAARERFGNANKLSSGEFAQVAQNPLVPLRSSIAGRFGANAF